MEITKKQTAGFALQDERTPPSFTDEDVQAMLESPDTETALIFSDWLQAKGDPRGELIAVHHRLSASDLDEETKRALTRQEMKLLFLHRQALFSDFGGTVIDEATQRYVLDLAQLEWKRGFVESAGLWLGRDQPMPAALKTHERLLTMMCESPSFKFLKAFRYGPFDLMLHHSLEAFAQAPLPKPLNTLEFAGGYSDPFFWARGVCAAGGLELDPLFGPGRPGSSRQIHAGAKVAARG